MSSARKDTDLVMVVTSDIAGQLRGKAMPLRARDHRSVIGVGWTPTNALITAFGPIATGHWGALGDLMLQPDFSTMIDIHIPDYQVDECFVIGNVLTLAGDPWDCCLRGQLMSAIDALREKHGLVLTAAFEHEFHYSGCQEQPGLGYSLRARRRLGAFPDRLSDVIDRCGLVPDTFMPEYGPGQCEFTIEPNNALRAADDAVVLREMTRSVARGLDARASFTPMMDPAGVGNGVHVHFSLQDINGAQVNYDSHRPHGLSQIAGSFLAGMLKLMPEYLCLTAPSVASYMRLVPYRWSAAYNNLGIQDREAGIRICPVFQGGTQDDTEDKFHFEYRAADAAASPYLGLAALIRAGTAGLDAALDAPEATRTDLTMIDADELSAMNIERLPLSLESALQRFATSAWAAEAFGETLVDTYLRHKRCEIAVMQDLSDEEICAKYAAAY